MSHDTTLHRLIRPGVRLAAASGVSPNQITTLRLLTALGAAGAVATGRAPATAIGAGVFLLSMLLDRADGELARQTGRSTPAGHAYDLAVGLHRQRRRPSGSRSRTRGAAGVGRPRDGPAGGRGRRRPVLAYEHRARGPGEGVQLRQGPRRRRSGRRHDLPAGAALARSLGAHAVRRGGSRPPRRRCGWAAGACGGATSWRRLKRRAKRAAPPVAAAGRASSSRHR